MHLSFFFELVPVRGDGTVKVQSSASRSASNAKPISCSHQIIEEFTGNIVSLFQAVLLFQASVQVQRLERVDFARAPAIFDLECVIIRKLDFFAHGLLRYGLGLRRRGRLRYN